MQRLLSKLRRRKLRGLRRPETDVRVVEILMRPSRVSKIFTLSLRYPSLFLECRTPHGSYNPDSDIRRPEDKILRLPGAGPEPKLIWSHTSVGALMLRTI